MTGPATDVPAPPADDADVPRFLAELGLPGLVDVHVHFLPERVMDKVWAYFDAAEPHYGMAWPIHYRTSEAERVATLRKLGVQHVRPAGLPAQARHGALAHRVGHRVRRRARPGPCRPPPSSRSRTWPTTSARRWRRAPGW